MHNPCCLSQQQPLTLLAPVQPLLSTLADMPTGTRCTMLVNRTLVQLNLLTHLWGSKLATFDTGVAQQFSQSRRTTGRAESVNPLVTVGVSSDCLAGRLLDADVGCLQTQPDSLQLAGICRGMEGLLHAEVGLLLRLCQQACGRLWCCGDSHGCMDG